MSWTAYRLVTNKPCETVNSTIIEVVFVLCLQKVSSNQSEFVLLPSSSESVESGAVGKITAVDH